MTLKAVATFYPDKAVDREILDQVTQHCVAMYLGGKSICRLDTGLISLLNNRGKYGTIYKYASEDRKLQFAVKVEARRQSLWPEHQVIEKVESAFATRVLFRKTGRIEFRDKSSTNGACTVMELLPGSFYSTHIKRTKRLSFEQFRQFGLQALQFLSDLKSAHILHADLKPENFAVTEQGQSIWCKFFDYTLSTFRPEQRELICTPWYRPPEVWLGWTDDYSFSVDMWSVGCILYEVLRLTGWPLFHLEEDDINGAFQKFFYMLGKAPDWMQSELDKRGFAFSGTYSSANLDRGIFEVMDQYKQYSPEIRQKKAAQLTDLLRQMLRYDPKERITPEQALEHPFFKMESEAEFPPSIRQIILDYLDDSLED